MDSLCGTATDRGFTQPAPGNQPYEDQARPDDGVPAKALLPANNAGEISQEIQKDHGNTQGEGMVPVRQAGT